MEVPVKGQQRDIVETKPPSLLAPQQKKKLPSLIIANPVAKDKRQRNAEATIRRLMENKKKKEGQVNLAPYEELLKDVKRERWFHVKRQLGELPDDDLVSPITEFYETMLHILVKWKKAHWLVEEIVDKIDAVSLEKTDYREDTALSVAASVGNTEAAEMMAKKNPQLLMKFNVGKKSPFHVAAKFGHEKTFYRLHFVAQTKLNIDDINEKLFSGVSGAKMVKYLLSANLYGISGTKKVTIPSIQTNNDDCLCINISNIGEDRNPTNKDGIKRSKLHNFFQNWGRKAFIKFRSIFPPPLIRIIYETKLKNNQALEIVQIMCEEVAWTFHDAIDALKEPALKAASLGIAEIVEEILKVYPAATMFYDDKNRTILQLAVLYRRDKVFNLFLKRCLSQKWVPTYPMRDNENVLHLAGKCVPSRQINGAALQMQLEMQWFTAVESVVHPLFLEERNGENKTPREVFEDEHKELIENGEKWMRDTASSCMVVDALIIAMVFAAIIAVPGNNERGIPNFRNEPLFKVFIVADAAALFSSSFSLLLFVRILTSRYAEEDFLKALPKRLLLGLITLIFSIAAMLVASSSALIMLMDAVPGPKVMIRKSTLIPVTILAALPVVFFVWSQSHLLIDVLLSTYRPPISFVKENDE